MTTRFMILTMLLVIALAGMFFAGQYRSLAQDPLRKQPACTMFCGDGTFNTFSLGAKPCWGGPLPPDNAGDHFNGLAKEDQAAICRNLTSGNANRSCPAVKTLLALCTPDLPQDKGKKPPCKERGEYDVPWFDPSSPSGCEDVRSTRMNANWTSEGGGTCVLTLTACNYTVLTMRVRFVNQGPLTYESYPGDVGSEGSSNRRITRPECTAQLYDQLIGDHPNKVCCDAWQEGVRAGSGCNPEKDADCDGLPNDRDNYLNSEPYHAPPRPKSYQSMFSEGSADFNPADFDPRPPGLSWDELMPNEPCKKCKWVATSGKLTCSPDGRAEHEYKATWICPSSGAVRTVTKRAPVSAPCTPPQHSRS